MSQPLGFVDHDHSHHVYKFRKVIYGLKQAPRVCYHELRQFLVTFGFCNSYADTSLFVFHTNGITMYLLVYVDNIIIIGDNDTAVQEFIQLLASQFSIKNLGHLNYFLGVEVIAHHQGLFLSQCQYVKDLLVKTHMTNTKPVT